MKILVLESSTASAKAMIYDTEDDSFRVEIQPYDKGCGDVQALHMERTFAQMAALGKKIAKDEKIDIVSLGSTWNNILLADKNMEPKTPCFTWASTDSAPICRELRRDKEYVRSFYHRTGCMVNAIYPYFKLLNLKRQGYRLSDYLVAEQGTYNCFRLTGKYVVTRCSASGSGLLNLYTGDYDAEILEQLGVDRGMLPGIVGSEVNYPLTREGAELLGLRPGIPVIPSSADGGLNQIGVGALNEGVMTFSVGTSGAIRLTVKEPILPENPSIWCYSSPKAYLSGAATNGCCSCVDWFRNKMLPTPLSYAELESVSCDEDTTPVFIPLIFGERCPGWNDEGMGSFFNIKPQHTIFDLYRAVQEGVLFNLYHCYTLLTAVNGTPAKIKFSGGILHSRRWSQMCADIFQADLEVDTVEYGSMMGAAILGMEHLGVIRDVRDFVPQTARIIRHNPEKREFYARKFERYLDCYRCDEERFEN